MTKHPVLLYAAVACLLATSCTPVPMPEVREEVRQEPVDNVENMTVNIIVGGKSFKADIEDSETVRAFLAKLPLSLDMDELNGNEKYCYGVSLPRDEKYCSSIAAGDLMLFGSNCIVLFYGPAGGYSYTRIGTLQSTDGLAAALGSGSVKVRFEKG